MTEAYINAIATAVPDFDVHQRFVDFAPSLLSDVRQRALFQRMAERAGIDSRYSTLGPDPDGMALDAQGFYVDGDFPDTGRRMRAYEQHAFALARRALDALNFEHYSERISHVIVTSCTGFYAPGLDLQVIRHYRLASSVERTIVGFMGCHAAINALKLARHIVRSQPDAQVAIINLELCTLHLQETDDLEQVLSFLIFADGCAASLVSADPVGLALESFHTTVLPDSARQITWHIGRRGFDMLLSGQVPLSVAKALMTQGRDLLGGLAPPSIRHWAVHPGGRSILDAVEQGLGLPQTALHASREVLRRFGNMSSATVMFVLQQLLQPGTAAGRGCAMAFGPGLSVESLLFRTAGGAN